MRVKVTAALHLPAFRDGVGRGGGQEPGASFINLQAVSLVGMRARLLGPSRAAPGARGLQAEGAGRRAHLVAVSPHRPTPPPRKEGLARGASRVGVRVHPRAVTAGQGPGGLDPSAPPRQRPPAPEAPGTPAGWDRSPTPASPTGAPSPAGPAPNALTPDPLAASLYSAGVRTMRPPRLRLRLSLRLPYRPPPALPREPAAPPRRRTRPAPAAAATNQRAVGVERAARQAQPIQPLLARRGAAGGDGAGDGRAIGQVC